MSAFDAFYLAYRADAVRWASGLVGSRAVGEELAQDALVAISDRFDTIERPGAYLRRTIVNRAASWHRDATRERARIERATAGLPTSYSESTNDMLDALHVLPYNQRAAVTLRYWADWTDAQIAEAIGCAPATVRVLLHRGIATLREEIAR